MKVTAAVLNRRWGVRAAHPLYKKDGTFFHVLRYFPGALFDANGYVLFQTRQDYESCPDLKITTRTHVPKGISSLPSYFRMRSANDGENPSPKVTRLSLNSADWRRPTGEARDSEIHGTYNQQNGFGHEDWLFRSEWTIGGWRYAFIEGVNKSHARLVREGKAFDLLLFTIQADRRRRYVASIRGVECLSDTQARDALLIFKKNGWYDTMRNEIRAVAGVETALGATRWAKHILNVRFRQENVTFFRNRLASDNDPIRRFTRYQLYDFPNTGDSFEKSLKTGPAGSEQPPKAVSWLRKACAAVQCTPEHAKMQAKLMEELKAEFPQAQIIREKEFIDISVQMEEKLILFEIKSDLEPRSVIRNALGQILEYAYYPTRNHKLPVSLVIVGRQKPSPEDDAYLKRLQIEFSLPIKYRVLEIG